MSDMIISDTIFSIILFRLQRFAIGHGISLLSGGYCFGVGVMVSLLYVLGQWHTLNPELIISAIGTHKNKAKSLIILSGISPGAVDLFVFIFSRYFLMTAGLN